MYVGVKTKYLECMYNMFQTYVATSDPVKVKFKQIVDNDIVLGKADGMI